MGQRRRTDSLDPIVLARIARAICVAVIALGAVVWLGWALGMDLLTRFIPDSPPVRPWTALWLICLAVAAFLQITPRETRKRYRTARVLALAIGMMALVVLVEYAHGGIRDIDRWWFGEAVQRSPLPFPGRPSQQTAVPTLFLALAVALLRIERRWVQPTRLVLMAFGALVPVVAVTADIFGGTGAVRFNASVRTAPATALGLVMVAAVVVLARPDAVPMRWFMTRPDTASLLRLLVVLLGFPFTLWTARTVLVLLGANVQTGQVFSIAFSTVVVAVAVFVVSRRQQQLIGERMAMVEDLREVTDRYRLLAENSSDVIMLASPETLLKWVSPSALPMLGWEPHELIGHLATEFLHPDDVDAVRESVAWSDATGTAIRPRYRWRRPDGSYRWMEAVGQPVEDDGTGTPGRVVQLRDIDAEVATQRALHDSEARYRLLAENASDLVLSISEEGTLTWASPSALSVLGFAPLELLGRPARSIVHPDDLGVVKGYREQLMSGRPRAVRVRLATKQGASIRCEVSARRLVNEDGSAGGVVAAVRDIRAEIAAEEALEREVAFDGLTGLPRKDPALQRIREMLAEHAQNGWWLLCVGVNGMTQINQAYTYTAGDEVLKTVAHRLLGIVGAHDRVARIAGDEFVVLKPDIVTATKAADAAERILAAVRGGVVVGDTELHVTASIGIAMAQSDDPEELLRDATAAMRQAAQKGPDRWEFLDGNVGAQTREALHIQGELRTALAEGRIEAWFMPIVELPSRRVVGYEALTRWPRADGSVWGPDLFLDIAERSGLIAELDHTVFMQTLAAAKHAPAEITYSYNVSATSLGSDAFPGWIA